jgi:hypothetical protein
MHAFDILAEAKMRRWEKERKSKGKKASAGRLLVDADECLEKQLYSEIRTLITASRDAAPEERHKLLMRAEKLQVQLSVRLEKGNLHHVAKWLGDEIRRLKLISASEK